MTDIDDPLIVLNPATRQAYFEGTFSAFEAFRNQRPGVCTVIQSDPLGPVNRIVRICRVDECGRRTSVKAALVRITAGTTVTLCRDETTWGIEEVMTLREGSWRIPPEHPELRELPTAPGWRVDVDGHTVLRASDSEIWPQPPAPRVPICQRATQAARRAAGKRARRVGDAIAHRFGYIHSDEAEDYL